MSLFTYKQCVKVGCRGRAYKHGLCYYCFNEGNPKPKKDESKKIDLTKQGEIKNE